MSYTYLRNNNLTIVKIIYIFIGIIFIDSFKLIISNKKNYFINIIMNDLTHPSSILDPQHTLLIRNESALAEKNGRFTKNQLNLIHQQQWLKILVPSQYGGREYALPEVLQLEEALAWADGSMGWMVTLCAGAGWFGGFWDTDIAKKIFQDPKMCIAGSGTITGTAEKTKGGYTINGEWPHASGSPDATVFTANCTIMQNGKPRKDEKGNDEVLSFLFLKNEVTVEDIWNTIGMVATASNSYKVSNLAVQEDRAFKINDHDLKIASPLYIFPFLQLAEATLAVNMSGMAFHFLDLCKTIFDEKRSKKVKSFIENEHIIQDSLEKHTHKLNDARSKFYYAIALSWQASVHSKQIKDAILYKVSSGAFDLAKRAREAVDALYPYCGLAAADKNAEINRVWRDLHTASQHHILVFGGSIE
jgi:indole-3-acetate monooxygenase